MFRQFPYVFVMLFDAVQARFWYELHRLLPRLVGSWVAEGYAYSGGRHDFLCKRCPGFISSVEELHIAWKEGYYDVARYWKAPQ